jgi:hypothetical protein
LGINVNIFFRQIFGKDFLKNVHFGKRLFPIFCHFAEIRELVLCKIEKKRFRFLKKVKEIIDKP